ncbi:unnamed protein product [Lampetra fluviatilis]
MEMTQQPWGWQPWRRGETRRRSSGMLAVAILDEIHGREVAVVEEETESYGATAPAAASQVSAEILEVPPKISANRRSSRLLPNVPTNQNPPRHHRHDQRWGLPSCHQGAAEFLPRVTESCRQRRSSLLSGSACPCFRNSPLLGATGPPSSAASL